MITYSKFEYNLTINILTVPADYDELLAFYTHRGFRVIACASKPIPALNPAQAEGMKRGEVESDLEFLGFVIFENKLKPASATAIQELNTAGIRNIMCTGDNILTAISVARECNLIDRSVHCFVPSFSDGTCAPVFRSVATIITKSNSA